MLVDPIVGNGNTPQIGTTSQPTGNSSQVQNNQTSSGADTSASASSSSMGTGHHETEEQSPEELDDGTYSAQPEGVSQNEDVVDGQNSDVEEAQTGHSDSHSDVSPSVNSDSLEHNSSADTAHSDTPTQSGTGYPNDSDSSSETQGGGTPVQQSATSPAKQWAGFSPVPQKAVTSTKEQPQSSAIIDYAAKFRVKLDQITAKYSERSVDDTKEALLIARSAEVSATMNSIIAGLKDAVNGDSSAREISFRDNLLTNPRAGDFRTGLHTQVLNLYRMF